MMLDRPDTVEPRLFRQQALLDDVVEDLLFIPARGIDHLRLIDDGKLHAGLPLAPIGCSDHAVGSRRMLSMEKDLLQNVFGRQSLPQEGGVVRAYKNSREGLALRLLCYKSLIP